MTQHAHIGIDVAKAHLDVAIRWDKQRVMHRQFAYTTAGQKQLLAWLADEGVAGTSVCLEATGRYSESIAVCLHDAGYRVSVEAPYRTKHFAKSLMTRQKTDKVDAQVLAHFSAVMETHQWLPMAQMTQNVRDLKRLLDDLNDDRTRAMNRLEGLRKGSPARRHLVGQVRQIEKRIEQVTTELEQAIDDDTQMATDYTLLKSIKGIGEVSARQLLAEITHWQRFANADALVAYAGLSPELIQSGNRAGSVRLSKRGNAQIRKALYFPALSAMQHNPHMKRFAERLKVQGKAKMSVVAAVMRKLLVLAYAVLKSGQPYDPNYGLSS